MEIRHTGLTRENRKLVSYLTKFISYYRAGKLNHKGPSQISISRKQYQRLDENLKQINCKPPYTLNNVLILPIQH